MTDNDYVGLSGNWSRLYRYIQYFGVQLAAGASNMVLVMPMFNNASWGNLGIFRMRCHDIVNGRFLVDFRHQADGRREHQKA